MNKETAWETYTDQQLEELEALSKRYRAFLNTCKTERECVAKIVQMAKEQGYRSLEEVRASGEPLRAGDKVYAVGMEKTIALFLIGEQPFEAGMRILGAHIDSPRLDVKQAPLYEDTGMAYLDTHYYGGIKKYQWVTIPLAIHGVVAKKDGTKVQVCIGESEEDPVLCISDLLVHLAGEQMEKRARLVIDGEDLDLLVGSRPAKSASDKDGKKEKEAVRQNILALLKEGYGIEEEDFMSAELEIVPADKAKDCGLDRSMILAYGQDDRVCAYTSVEALFSEPAQTRTCCALLVDKEEVGSVGATGMQSRFFENTVAEMMDCAGQYSELALRRALSRSRMLSSDVSAAYDPLYAKVFEKNNSAYFGKGLVFNKYTGSRGKSNSNDANAEYMAAVRQMLDAHGVAYQTAELGRVDAGGGGTIAYICALYGMEVIDSGVAVLNMHAPMEITSKADVYEAKKGYQAFLEEA